MGSPLGVGMRAEGAPILRATRADFWRSMHPLCALRAPNMPAFGGCGHKKPPHALRGSFGVGGSLYPAVLKMGSKPRQIARKLGSKLGVFSRSCDK